MNDSTPRYEPIPDDIISDIIAGVGDNRDTVTKATDFLQMFSEWAVQFIEIIKDFFAKISSAKV